MGRIQWRSCGSSMWWSCWGIESIIFWRQAWVIGARQLEAGTAVFPKLLGWFRASGRSAFLAFLVAVVASNAHLSVLLLWIGSIGFTFSVALWVQAKVKANRRTTARTAFFETLRKPDTEAE